jgi:ABC-type transporter Mla subunit MlaD
MELMSSEPTSADILAAALKTSFAPLIAFQRDIQRLTQGIGEFRQDLKASLGQTSQILNEGLKASSEAISSVQDALKRGAKLTLDFDRIMTDLKIDKKFTPEQSAAAQDRIHSLAQSTGRTSGEIAQIIKTNSARRGANGG